MEISSEYQRTFALVQCGARTRLSPSCEERIRELVRKEIEWDVLIQLAEFHGVWPLVYSSLKQVCPDAVPENVSDQLRRRAHATATHSTFLARELSRLLTLFETCGLPAIAFKGPVLAAVAYGDIRQRPCIDLDILVRKADYPAAKQMLMEDEYTPHEKIKRLSGLREKMYLWLARQCPFRRGAGVFNVDLHMDIMPPLYSYAVNFETLWQRTEVVSMGGAQVRSFEVEDLLQILCYHGAKNRWEALKHVCDVAELIQSHPDLNWDCVVQRARRTNGERILHLGVYLAHALLDVHLPPDVLAGAVRQKQVQRVAVRLIEQLPNQMYRGMASFGERFRFHLAIQDTLAAKVRYGAIALLRRVTDLFQHDV